jgi:hypothetical protein
MAMKESPKTKAPAKVVLLERAAIETLIGKIQVAGLKLDGMIQQAAVQAAMHSHIHNEISLCEKLLKALPAGLRSNALKEWMCFYAPVAFVDDATTFSRSYEPTDETARKAAVEAAKEAKVWTLFKPEPKFQAFDFTARISAVLKQAEAALKDTANADKHKVSTEHVKALKALLQPTAPL